jgi:hypothetical protein
MVTANTSSASATALPPIASSIKPVVIMPQLSTATPGSISQLAKRQGQTAGRSAWIATGSSWNPAPMAVTVNTPRVIR